MNCHFGDWWNGLFGGDDQKFDVDIETVRSQCRDYVLIMLGAPVLKLEFDETALSKIVSLAQEMIMASDKVKPKQFRLLMQEASLAFAKIVLGRIRSKYAGAPGPNGAVFLDGGLLLKEGSEELSHLQERLGLM